LLSLSKLGTLRPFPSGANFAVWPEAPTAVTAVGTFGQTADFNENLFNPDNALENLFRA
jgi:hypothetical protein